jgi:hypothetical protein
LSRIFTLPHPDILLYHSLLALNFLPSLHTLHTQLWNTQFTFLPT